jgi:hypothetical protein
MSSAGERGEVCGKSDDGATLYVDRCGTCGGSNICGKTSDIDEPADPTLGYIVIGALFVVAMLVLFVYYRQRKVAQAEHIARGGHPPPSATGGAPATDPAAAQQAQQAQQQYQQSQRPASGSTYQLGY